MVEGSKLRELNSMNSRKIFLMLCSKGSPQYRAGMLTLSVKTLIISAATM